MTDSTRTKTHKTPMNEAEVSRLRRIATAHGMQCAPFVRWLIAKEGDQFDLAASPCKQSHGIGARINKEGPRHGHFASHRRRVVLPNAKAIFGARSPHLRV